MTRHERTIIELSLSILDAAMMRSKDGPVGTDEVRLALRCLLPHCPERWPLKAFWEAVVQEGEFGRSQGCTAGLNGIIHQLRQAGKYPE